VTYYSVVFAVFAVVEAIVVIGVEVGGLHGVWSGVAWVAFGLLLAFTFIAITGSLWLPSRTESPDRARDRPEDGQAKS
jgi:hypothetical protein